MVESLEMSMIKCRQLANVESTGFVLIWKVTEFNQVQERRRQNGLKKLLRHALNVNASQVYKLEFVTEWLQTWVNLLRSG